MGWAYGQNAEGRDIGYSVEATCDLDGCEEEIDRGLAFCCGGMHDGGEYGCGEYFCPEHLFFSECPDQLCASCMETFQKESLPALTCECGHAHKRHNNDGEDCSLCDCEEFQSKESI